MSTETPIYVQSTDSVDPKYKEATLDLLDRLDNISDYDIEFRDVDSWSPSSSDYRGTDFRPPKFSSSQWYEQEATVNNRGRKQVAVGEMAKLLHDEPWRREDKYGEHVDVFLTGKDITGKGQNGGYLNYVLGGVTGARDHEKETTSVVLSPQRLEEAAERSHYSMSGGDVSLSEHAFRTLAAHEFGHLFDAPNPSRGKNLDFSFEGQPHCANNDVMQKGESAMDIIELTVDRLNGDVETYCDDCWDDIQEGIRTF